MFILCLRSEAGKLTVETVVHTDRETRAVLVEASIQSDLTVGRIKLWSRIHGERYGPEGTRWASAVGSGEKRVRGKAWKGRVTGRPIYGEISRVRPYEGEFCGVDTRGRFEGSEKVTLEEEAWERYCHNHGCPCRRLTNLRLFFFFNFIILYTYSAVLGHDSLNTHSLS